MNNLEKEIEQAIINHEHGLTSDVIPDYAKVAASVAMKWIESAFQAGIIYGTNDEDGRAPQDALIGFLRQNGLTPTEPDTKESPEDAYWKSYLDEPVVWKQWNNRSRTDRIKFGNY